MMRDEITGVPVIEGYGVDCLSMELELQPHLGGLKAYIHLAGRSDYRRCFVAEIPPGGKLKPERHRRDELICVLKGHGVTIIEDADGTKHSCEWNAGTLFHVARNTAHQLFNRSDAEACRMVVIRG